VVEEFDERFDTPAADVVEEASAALADLAGLRGARHRLAQESADEERALERWLQDRLEVLRDSGVITDAPADGLGERLAQVEAAHREARDSLEGRTATEIRAGIDDLNRRIEELDERIAAVEEALARVEEQLVAEATIVATTLTRAYLRDYIQDRRFDTVVLDEASMAPIPALWIAAGVADHGVVIVGDPHQLPPIKHSQLDVAEKWLGEEIFTIAGVLDRAGNGGGGDHLVRLRTQYRMHPDISRLPNKLVYKNRLIDGPGAADDEADLDGWYDRDWGGDAPVLLVDTGPLDAWVTTVDRGTKTSRLNFLSATIACDLAEKMLAEGRDPLEPGAQPRILIVTPYRPQANLLERLIEHQGLDDEVAVGTAHSFQGNEAPVVILDLVVDEPHWRVGLSSPPSTTRTGSS
jgi:superfamily I DNA and/or RNA helicase